MIYAKFLPLSFMVVVFLHFVQKNVLNRYTTRLRISMYFVTMIQKFHCFDCFSLIAGCCFTGLI